MDKVFEPSKPRTSSKLKNLFHSDQKYKQKPKYFPLKGGDGEESLSNFFPPPTPLSYEAAEEMEDTQVDIPSDKKFNIPTFFKRKEERIQMPVPDFDSILCEPATLDPLNPNHNFMREPNPDTPDSLGTPGTPGTPGTSGTSGTPNVDSVETHLHTPTYVQSAVQFVRFVSKKTVVLGFLDSVADYAPQLEGLVVSIELFILLLVLNFVAEIVQYLCFPAVLILRMIFYLF